MFIIFVGKFMGLDWSEFFGMYVYEFFKENMVFFNVRIF